MKKIGFVDYYISEWHADNYPAWFQQACEKNGLDYTVAYAWAEQDISPVSGESTDQWCRRMGVTRCNSIAELCQKSDVLLILSPSNPEKHLEYAGEVLTYGKPVYIDKTFAPNLQTALEIFRIAEESHTPFFSSSALRYSEELGDVTGSPYLILTGGGSNLEEYVIHLIEMAVVLLKSPAVKVKAEHLGQQRICTILAENGAKACLIYSPALGYSVTAEDNSGTTVHRNVESPFFLHLITDILLFFEKGIPSFPSEETLEVMKLRDGILKADKEEGTWIAV